jgi:NADH-quinone oxidoreductase subunit C
MPDFSQLVDIVKKLSSDITVDEKSSPSAILVPSQDLIKICTELHQNPETYFDMLSCVTGIDNGVHANTMDGV